MNGADILMIKVNIVFDNALEDADIIAVPDEFISEIEAIGQNFLNEIPAMGNDYRTVINGQEYFVAETDGFIKWFNLHYCSATEKAYIVAKNTNYCPQYKTIEF